jgi:hypothetical protein
MKFLIAFALCFFCVSYEASAIYSVEKQGILMPNSTRSMSNSDVPTIQKQRYKERVLLKYRQFKSKVIDNKWVRRFLKGGIVLLILGLALIIPFNRLTSANSTANPTVNQAIGIGVGYLLGIASLIVSGVLFIAALVAAIV